MDGELGVFELEDNCMLPFAIQRLYNLSKLRYYYSSGIGPGCHNGNNSEKIPVANNIKSVPIVSHVQNVML